MSTETYVERLVSTLRCDKPRVFKSMEPDRCICIRCTAADVIERLCRERDQLAEAVMHYGYHDSECATRDGKAAPCSCGYDELYDKCVALTERSNES